MGCKQPNFKRKPNSQNPRDEKDEKDVIFIRKKYIFQIHLPDTKERLLDKKFKEFEKEELKKLFENLIKNYENTILKDNYFNLHTIDERLISNIIENEQSSLIYKKKIVDAISNITEKKEEHQIKQLTILVLGKKLVGKTTLIEYILKLDEKEINNNKENIDSKIIHENNFISYKNKKVPYLKLIEFKGISLDINQSPEKIQEEALECIKNKISVPKVKNEYTEYINCIWYCITGERI